MHKLILSLKTDFPVEESTVSFMRVGSSGLSIPSRLISSHLIFIFIIL